MIAAGLVFLLVGVFLTAFGAVYSTSTDIALVGDCGPGCGETFGATVVTAYYLYPIWGPPTWNSANYQLTSCSIRAWYTPLNPPSSCVPQPDSSTPNYILNAVGAIWMVGGVAFLLKGRSRPPVPAVPQPAQAD